MNCEHKNIEEWDCGCMFGPPSCQSCHIRGYCKDCGSTMFYEPTKKKTTAKTGSICEECKQPFDGVSLLRKHREQEHGWSKGGRQKPSTIIRFS